MWGTLVQAHFLIQRLDERSSPKGQLKDENNAVAMPGAMERNYR
jgi:hypothetical protein